MDLLTTQDPAQQDLTQQVATLRRELAEAKYEVGFHRARVSRAERDLLSKMYRAAFDCLMPDNLESNVAIDRITELMADDRDNELWKPVRDFEVVFRIDVTLKVEAGTEEEAIAKATRVFEVADAEGAAERSVDNAGGEVVNVDWDFEEANEV
jgi:hypothetical protein